MSKYPSSIGSFVIGQSPIQSSAEDTTGPPYPRPGTSAIGEDSIGAIQIGTPPQLDYWDTIISQYANSPRIDALVAFWFDCIDQTRNLDEFYDLVWNIDTAQGYGLDVWGRIVDVSRRLNITIGGWFGFAEAGDAYTFGQGAYFSGVSVTANYILTDEVYRRIILCKAFTNVMDGSIISYNKLLMTLFPGRGNAYVQDGNIPTEYFGFAESLTADGWNQAPFYSGASVALMKMTYTFEFIPNPVELAIIQQSGVLPRPTGVAAAVQTL